MEAVLCRDRCFLWRPDRAPGGLTGGARAKPAINRGAPDWRTTSVSQCSVVGPRVQSWALGFRANWSAGRVDHPREVNPELERRTRLAKAERSAPRCGAPRRRSLERKCHAFRALVTPPGSGPDSRE